MMRHVTRFHDVSETLKLPSKTLRNHQGCCASLVSRISQSRVHPNDTLGARRKPPAPSVGISTNSVPTRGRLRTKILYHCNPSTAYLIVQPIPAVRRPALREHRLQPHLGYASTASHLWGQGPEDSGRSFVRSFLILSRF